MKIIIDGEAVEIPGGGGSSGGVTMDEVNQAIESKLDEYTPQEVYSTEETRIGTWIDGKPLYRIVFHRDVSNLSGVLNTSFALPSNVEEVVFIYGNIVKNTNQTFSIPYYVGSEGVYTLSDVSSIRVMSASALKYKRLAIAVEYTKTTD